jgi:hypothetical protein
MTYNVGDPNHLGVHNDLTASVQTAASRVGVEVILPDTANLGDTGHVDDHNLLATALAEIAAAGGGMAWAKVTGGTVTTVTNPDSSVDEIHTFTGNGTLTVDTPGYAQVFMISGGSPQVGGNAGSGGRVLRGIHALPAGALSVSVGIAGASGVSGGPSSIGTLSTYAPSFYYGGAGAPAPHSGDGASDSGIVDSITGTPITYGAIVTTPVANLGNGKTGGAGNASTGIVIVRVQTTAPTVSGVVASGGTETTYVGDGSNGVLGKRYRLHSFTTPGTQSLAVSQGGMAEFLLISGAAGDAPNGNAKDADAGFAYRGVTMLGQGTVTVVVGNKGAGAYGQTGSGGKSSVGFAVVPGGTSGQGGNGAGADGASRTGDGAGYTSSITGSPVVYCKGSALAGPHSTPGSSNDGDGGANGIPGAVFIRYEIA